MSASGFGGLVYTPKTDTGCLPLGPGGVHLWADTHQRQTLLLGRHPSRQTPTGRPPTPDKRRPLKHAVRILLESILVFLGGRGRLSIS